MDEIVLLDNVFCVKTFYLMCIYHVLTHSKKTHDEKSVLVSFQLNLDSMELETRMVKIPEPPYRIVLQHLYFSSDLFALSLNDDCIIFQHVI